MSEPLRRLALRAVTSRAFALLHRALTHDAGTIFMLHRFADSDRGVRGHHPTVLRRMLRWLRRRDIPLLSLEEFVRRVQRSEPLEGAVTFTVDDGYRDFADVAIEVFAEFECPVTVFLPTAFIDGDTWLWWDEIRYMIEETAVPRLPLPDRHDGSDEPAVLPLEGRGARRRARRALVERLKGRSPDRVERGLSAVARALEVSRPDAGDNHRFSPLTWEQVRECSARGASFGPHTRTHPWLSAVTREEAEREIAGSWRRLREELDAPVPILGYPFGTPGSFGSREVRIARDHGLDAAVSTVPQMVRSPGAGRDGSLYRLPRIGLPHDVPRARKIVTGIDLLLE